MILTRGLTKRYGHLLVVDQVDLDVREGDRYGFLGPNGSGKTTVVRMLLGLVYATSGEITVLGQPVPKRVGEVLPSIGSLVEGPSAYGHLSGRANLALIDAAGKSGSRRTRRSRIAATLDRVGLGGIDNRPVKRYSLGMRQRLGLAAALLRTPKLLILDEPTNGLDPQGIREIRDLLIELNAAGTTVFLSSHQLSEVEQLCTRVGIVDRGRLVRQDDLETLRALTGRSIVRTPDTERAREVLDGQIELAECGRLVVAERGYRGAQLPPGRPRRPGHRDRRRTAVAGGRGALGDRLRLGPRRRLERGSAGDPRRAGQAGAPPAQLGEPHAALRPARAGGGVRRGDPPRAAPGPGPGPAVRGAVQRVALPGRGARHRAAHLPAGRGRGGGGRLHRGRGRVGTLRYLLARPVGRTRLLAAKLIALIVYTLSAVILVAVTAYLTGIALFGAQPVAATPGGLTTSDIAATSLSGSGLTPADIALRTIGAVAFIAVSMLGVGAIALFLSTITDSALGAALGALAALITSEVLVSLNAASAVNPYLPTRYWLAWIDFFRDPIVWRNIERGFAVQGVYVVVFLAASWAHFATKDITS